MKERARQGLFGLCTARAAAIVIRLSLIYALLDGSPEIRREHLDAAYECWRYCEESAKYIFGDSLGDPVADRILKALQGNQNGLTRKDISLLFQRHKQNDEISRALAVLQQANLAYSTKLETNGRPTELWKAGKARTA